MTMSTDYATLRQEVYDIGDLVERYLASIYFPYDIAVYMGDRLGQIRDMFEVAHADIQNQGPKDDSKIAVAVHTINLKNIELILKQIKGYIKDINLDQLERAIQALPG